MFKFKSFVRSLATITALVSLPLVLHAQDYEGGESLPAPIVAQSDSGAYGAINQLPASIRESLPFAREFYEFARHASSSGTVDNNAYRKAFEEARGDMLRDRDRNFKGTTAQSILGTNWTNIGLTSTSDTIPTAGIIRAITFDPQNPAVMYAGSNGGVWKSTDTGANWMELTDNWLPNLSVNTIAVDPANSNTIFVGTGNCEIGIPPYNGTGLYRSEDGGASWQLLKVAGVDFVKVIVDPDPSKHNIVLAAAYPSGPLYRSTNSGDSWSTVSSVSGLPWDIIATPTPNTIFYLSSSTGIYKSTDDGANWTRTTNSSNFVTNIGRSAIASPAMDPNKVFALVTDGGGSQVHLFMTANGGTTWDSLKIESQIGDLFNPKVNSQGWYDLALAVSPNSTTTDTLYIDGVMAYRFTGTDNDLIQGTSNALALKFSDYDHSSGGSGYPHVDHHAIVISPVKSNIIYDGDDGGLYVNYEAGSNDLSGGGWILHSHNMVTNRIYHIMMQRTNPKLTYAGLQDQGLWEVQTGKDPNTFANDRMGDALQPLINLQSGTLFGEAPMGLIYEDISNNWSSVPQVGWWHDDSAWDTPLQLSSVSRGSVPSSSIMYAGRQHLWQSTNAGKSFTELNPTHGFGGTGDGTFLCSAIGLPNWNANMIYAAGGGNQFWASTDFGVTWPARTFPANGGVVTSINTNYQNPGFIVVTLEGSKFKVMTSNDSGKTWTDASGSPGFNIPGADTNTSCNVMSMAIDSLDPLHTWYAGTDFGMFATQDAGQQWYFMGPGLFPVRDVQLAANKTTLRIGTFGRGLWELTLPYSFNGVELTSLSAAKQSGGTALSWYVDGEHAGAEYHIERSLDGDAFETIGTVPGIGASSGRHEYAYTDNTTDPGTYLYRIHAVNADGSEHYTNQVELHYGTDGIYFSQPYPNPFVLDGNSSITLNYELPSLDRVTIRIYTINGTLVRTLLDREQDGGPHTLAWDARDATGNLVTPGAYFCTIQSAGAGTVTNKIMVVRQ